MTDLVSSIFRVIGLVLKVFLQLKVIELIVYSVGFAVAKAFSLGRFPTLDISESERVKVNYIGLLSITVILLMIGVINGFVNISL
ncbi:hypothetical protein [Vibrio sp. CAU 1672]|uniref:hypothetical protein n=1 Tax=Vibrio sp. CAU 1672 TaxID=3032594 RepID=UPI0023DCC021|nr:hypothetical protein [Vibrio sp. CAU 1672]MDF2154574.1 hypothetical protein [Vibrio sp. CAU 1672]